MIRLTGNYLRNRYRERYRARYIKPFPQKGLYLKKFTGIGDNQRVKSGRS